MCAYIRLLRANRIIVYNTTACSKAVRIKMFKLCNEVYIRKSRNKNVPSECLTQKNDIE